MSRYRTFARGWRQAVPAAAGNAGEPTDPPTGPVLPTGDGSTLEHLWPADHAAGENQTGQVGTTPEGALELLATPVDRTDLASTLTRLRSGARPGRSTTALAALLLAGIGFTGGVFAQKAMTPAGSTTTSAGTAAGGAGRGLGGAGGFGAGAGAGGGGNGVTVGTVQLVDGSTVYVQTAGGGVTIVHTGPHTTVRVTKTATVKDLVPGTTVVVQGAAAGDGAVQATTISQGRGLGRGTFGGSGGLGGSSTGRSGSGAASPSPSPSSP